MFHLTNRIWKIRNVYVLVSELMGSERLIQELAETGKDDITLYINSLGGSV